MKRYIDLPLFKKRLEQALTEKQSEFARLSRFKNRPFTVSSGADLAYVWYEYFGDPIEGATTKLWLRGKGLPSPENLARLGQLVGKPLSWLIVFRGDGAQQSPSPVEANQISAAYEEDSARSEALGAIEAIESGMQTIARIVKEKL